MSEPQEHAGLVGSVVNASGRLLGNLPPAFLLLCIINIAFLALVMWFVDDQMDQRMQLLLRIVERCLAH